MWSSLLDLLKHHTLHSRGGIMVANDRALRSLSLEKTTKPAEIKELKLDLSPNSLVLDVFSGNVVGNEYKLELIRQALVKLYLLDIQIDKQKEILWEEDFRKKFKRALHHFLLLLPHSEFGGIRYFDMEIIFQGHKCKMVYNLVKPIFYFE